MYRKIIAYLICFLLLSVNTVYAEEMPEISAECSVVMDVSTKRVIYQKNANLEHAMASTTKIMTCLIACERGSLGDTVTVSNEMLAGTEGTLIDLRAGDKITLLDLVKGAMLASGNDAANAIAVHLAGSIESFVLLMNKKAKTLGMKNTTFVTPSGLDDTGHCSTAYDMALLACEAMKNETMAEIAKIKYDEITVSKRTQQVKNHNKLLSMDERFIGLKTGFTRKAGRCLVSVYDNNQSNIVIVTLGAPNDWDDHIRLANFAKTKYNIKTEEGSLRINTVGANEETAQCKYFYSVNSLDDIEVKLYYYPFIYAPYRIGEVVGYARIYSRNTVLKTVDITVNGESDYG